MRVRHLLVALAAVVSVSATAHAQCFLNDNLDSDPCCSPVSLVLPSSIPALTAQAQGICWTGCNLSAQTCSVVSLSSLVPTPVCGEFNSTLSVMDCTGLPLMAGTLVLDYTRNWQESVVAGQIDYQVWRFMAKVDMTKISTPPPTCPIPACLGTVPACFFYGYVDYAFHCNTSQWEMSLVLFHGCDAFQHMPPLFSAVPGTFHPGATYAIVAPDTVLNPFVPVNMFPGGGPLVAEAVRTMPPATGGSCLAEDWVFNGAFTPQLQGCLCTFALNPPQNATIPFGGTGACGNTFGAINLWPIVPWYDLISTSIGSWTTGATYPGPERAWVLEGLFRYDNVCSSGGVVEQTYDIFYGSLTMGGYVPIPHDPVIPLTPNFVDLATNYTTKVGNPPTFPLFGAVGATDHLIYVNF